MRVVKRAKPVSVVVGGALMIAGFLGLWLAAIPSAGPGDGRRLCLDSSSPSWHWFKVPSSCPGIAGPSTWRWYECRQQMSFPDSCPWPCSRRKFYPCPNLQTLPVHTCGWPL